MAEAKVRWPSPGRPPGVAITLLGTFALHVDDAAVSLPPSAQRLVGVLALRGRLARSRLAGILWPEATEQRALASLRTSIWRVNQAAAGLVVGDNGGVHLGLSPRVDLHQLSDYGHAVLDDAAAALSGASRLPPVDCTDPDGAGLLPDWEDPWLDQERERLRQLCLHVMDAEARWYAQERRFGLALDRALAALRADELRESAHRLVVEMHVAEGNGAEAQRSFEHCCDVLRRELGTGPSAELCGLLPDRSGLERPGARARSPA